MRRRPARAGRCDPVHDDADDPGPGRARFRRPFRRWTPPNQALRPAQAGLSGIVRRHIGGFSPGMKQRPECRTEALSSADHVRWPAVPDRPGTRSPRRLGRAFATAGLIMIPWVLYLSMSLPKEAMDSHWALAWVGLDSCEALALFATGRFLKRADNRCTL